MASSSHRAHVLPWGCCRSAPRPKPYPKAPSQDGMGRYRPGTTLQLQPHDAQVMPLESSNLHPIGLKSRSEMPIPDDSAIKHSSERQKWKLSPVKSIDPPTGEPRKLIPTISSLALHLVQFLSDKSIHDCSSHLGSRTNSPSRSYHWEMVSKGLRRYPLSYAHSISAVHAPLSQSLPP